MRKLNLTAVKIIARGRTGREAFAEVCKIGHCKVRRVSQKEISSSVFCIVFFSCFG